MNKKNKFIIFLIAIVILIFISSMLLNVKTLNYKLKYKGETLKIKEISNKDNYYISVKTKNKEYSLYIFDDAKKRRKSVTDIYYYEDNTYECILPIIDDEVKTDLMCYKGEAIYNYSNLKGESNALDNFASSISLYNPNKYIDSNVSSAKDNNIKFYSDIKNIVAITTYKGVNISGKEIKLFDKDIYNNKISTFVDNYYLTADYNSNFEFKYFYIVNLETSEVKRLKLKNEISFDSYIQGIVDNKVYLYDKDNEIQYEIDVKKEKVDIVSSDDSIKYYKNNGWELLSKTQAFKETYFDYTSLDNNFTDYDIVNESLNYFYLLKKNENGYDLYRVDKHNIKIKLCIGNIPTDKIFYNDNYIYYVYQNKVYYYSDETNFKTVLEDSELEFNDTIKYYIY